MAEIEATIAATHKGKNSNRNSNKIPQARIFSGKNNNLNKLDNSISEEMIYKSVVMKKGRNSSSSEDIVEIDTSDGTLNLDFEGLNVITGLVTGEEGEHSSERRSLPEQQSENRRWSSEPQPSTSHGNHGHFQPRQLSPEEKADQMIWSAEMARAKILPKAGKTLFSHTALIDESYIVVGRHVDQLTMDRIWKGEYIDFGKLVPKDQVLVEEDQHLEMVIRGDRTYYVPVSDTTSISGYPRWEQAFRVYSNIYTKAHPERASELIEYNHIIHTIS